MFRKFLKSVSSELLSQDTPKQGSTITAISIMFFICILSEIYVNLIAVIWPVIRHSLASELPCNVFDPKAYYP